MTGILQLVPSVIGKYNMNGTWSWMVRYQYSCYLSNPVPIMLMLFNDFEGNAMNVLRCLFIDCSQQCKPACICTGYAWANFSRHASTHFPVNHTQWCSHSTFAGLSIPKYFTIHVNCARRVSLKVLLYYTAHSAMHSLNFKGFR